MAVTASTKRARPCTYSLLHDNVFCLILSSATSESSVSPIEKIASDNTSHATPRHAEYVEYV